MQSTDLILWLQNWIYNQWKKHLGYQVSITTIDNPGWGVTIDLQNFSNKKLPLADVENSESDWFYCTIQDNHFEGDGGLYNLIDILHVFINLTCINDEHCLINIEKVINEDLTWLLHWFATQCNGDWEHEFGIHITTLNPPGWHVTISLIDTELEDMDFEGIAIKRSETDWLFCFIKEGNFEGSCGLFNLPEVLKAFKDWASAYQRKYT